MQTNSCKESLFKFFWEHDIQIRVFKRRMKEGKF